jgi:hypothetical protein
MRCLSKRVVLVAVLVLLQAVVQESPLVLASAWDACGECDSSACTDRGLES